MTNIIYRQTTTPTVPSSTSAKGSPLTNLEVDGNFKSIVTDLGTKAPSDSPTFTGTPVAPTQNGSISDTSLATTAHVSAKNALIVVGTRTSTTTPITGTGVILSGASSSLAGIMVAADKVRLDGLTNYTHPANHPPSIITQDTTNRFTTDAEKATWNAKQAALVSGTNIKTVGGVSLTGSGDIGVLGVAYGGTGGATAYSANTSLARASVIHNPATNTVMCAGNTYMVFTGGGGGGGAKNLQMPSSANTMDGDVIIIQNLALQWATNNLTITRNGNTYINELGENLVCAVNVGGIKLVCNRNDGTNAYWNVSAC